MEKDMLASRRSETFMKTTKALFGILTITAALAMDGRAQVYQLSTPISGYMTMGALEITSPTGGGGTLYLNTLTETVYIDPVASTIRQVGSVSVSSATPQQFVIHVTQIMPQPFPNPAITNIGDITVTLAPVSTNFLFDTGVQPFTYNAQLGLYTFNGHVQFAPIPFTGSYSLVTGTETFSGVFSYTMSQRVGSLTTFDQLSTPDYPMSISLGGSVGDTGSYPPEYFKANTNLVADVTATNGFHMQLRPGSSNWFYDLGVDWWVWSSGSVTATLVAPTNFPVITAQPQSVAVHAHDTALFSVAASGTVPLSYQWSFNGTNIAGATLSSLTLPNVMQTNLGTYAVVVTNGVGSATSSNATLSMYPFIATPFAGATAYWGKPATFGIQAWGTGPLGYQWYKDGVPILNANTQSLTFASIQSTNAGLYSVVVTSYLGSVTNAPAEVIVYPAGVSLGFCPSVTISGVIGYSYIIQSTTDLTKTNSWITLTNLTLTQPVQLWVDTSVDASAPANSKYFYRVLPGQ